VELSAPYEGGYFLPSFDTMLFILYTPEEAAKDTFLTYYRNPCICGGTMCELNAYIYQEGKEQLFLENVNSARYEEGKVHLRNLFGEQKEFAGTIQEISLSGRRIVLAKR